MSLLRNLLRGSSQAKRRISEIPQVSDAWPEALRSPARMPRRAAEFAPRADRARDALGSAVAGGALAIRPVHLHVAPVRACRRQLRSTARVSRDPHVGRGRPCQTTCHVLCGVANFSSKNPFQNRADPPRTAELGPESGHVLSSPPLVGPCHNVSVEIDANSGRGRANAGRGLPT